MRKIRAFLVENPGACAENPGAFVENPSGLVGNPGAYAVCGESRRVRWKYAEIRRVLNRGSAFNKNGFAALFAITFEKQLNEYRPLRPGVGT